MSYSNVKMLDKSWKPLGGGKYVKWDDHYKYFIITEDAIDSDASYSELTLTVQEMTNLVEWQKVILETTEQVKMTHPNKTARAKGDGG
jgi:hypothetical protein